MSTGVGTYYERLGRWNSVARTLGYGGGRATLTVHRALADPQAGGRATHTRLHDVLRAHLVVRAMPTVLDAGCGLGGTMLDLASALGATCTGLTLSPSQAATAHAAARSRGLADRVGAHVRSYDEPPPGPYDVVVAIESLAHSADPAHSVRCLASVLAPGGVLAVVDDMPLVDDADPDLAWFKRGWRCPVLMSAAAYRQVLAAAGLSLEHDVDLTPACRPRTQRRLALLTRLNRAAHAVVPGAGWRAVMDSHMGGLALERLIRRGASEYRLLVARRPAVQVS